MTNDTMSKLNTLIVVRLPQDVTDECTWTAQHLGVSLSEVARRSLRIALPILKELSAPGVKFTTKHPSDERTPPEAA